ncbi:MAG: capsular exopolysaccharide family, partial [Modestobacter sp.]|nr:capsular exopolysaccharide family [Modestobacter sp.]
MGLTQYLSSLVRRWYLLVIGLVLGGALAGGYLATTESVYTANTQLFVSTTSSTDVSSAAAGVTLSQERTASYVQLVGGRELASMVIADLGLDMTPNQLMSEITAQALAETVIVQVDVTDSSAERAEAIAESIGDQFTLLVNEIETPPGATTAPLRVSIVAAPELPTAPSSPDVPLVLAAGLLLGLVLGAVVAVVRDRLDTSVRDEDAATAAAGAPVLGLVPDEPVQPGTLAELQPDSQQTEALHVVRTNLQFVSVDSKPRVLMVTSADQGEGKTTTAIRLAQVLADAGRRVLLIEADVRRPRATRYLGAISGAGLTNVLAGTVEFDDVVQPIGDGGLDLLAAGPKPPNPSELLGSEAMTALLGRLTDEYDLVVVDAPPLLPVADAVGLASLCDGVVLCVRWGVTGRDRLERAREMLDRGNAHTLGSVLTFVPRRAAGTYQYSYSDSPEDGRGGRLRRLLDRRRPDADAPVAEPP